LARTVTIIDSGASKGASAKPEIVFVVNLKFYRCNMAVMAAMATM
jgi:hypothetical protein